MGAGLPPPLIDLLGPSIEVLPWDTSPGFRALARVVGIITYGHPIVDGPLMHRTPHLGSASNRTRQRKIEMTVENLFAGLEGHQLPYRCR
jgi:hypothetical protein